jgi:hypothetical protein
MRNDGLNTDTVGDFDIKSLVIFLQQIINCEASQFYSSKLAVFLAYWSLTIARYCERIILASLDSAMSLTYYHDDLGFTTAEGHSLQN